MRLVVLLACLLFPLTAGAQSSQGQPTGTITVQETAGEDSAIATRIRDILAELDGYADVTVKVSSGIVSLSGTTLDAAKSQQLTDLVGRVAGVVAIENNVTESTDVAQRLDPVVARMQARLAQAVSFLPLLGVAFAAFLLTLALGFFIARRRQPWDRLAPNAFIADIFRQIIRLLSLIGGLVIALDIIGATALLSGILGAAGIVGLAIGFAVRDTVENFIASIMLSVRQPFRPNDTVEIEGDIGKVIRLTSRATILLSFDGNHIRIPNATVFKSRIVNYTSNPERRFLFELGMAPDTDFKAARNLALDTLNTLPFVLGSPEPGVWIETIGDSTISLQMAAWINQNDTSINLARAEAIRLVIAAFDAAGFKMPEPTYRVTSSASPAPKPPQTAKNTVPPSRVTPPDPSAVDDVGAKADKVLKQIVDQERAGTDTDLLGPEGTHE